jgi:putative ABC transport system ATP-binding protein
MIQAKDVTVRFDQETVLDKLSFEVKQGSKVAVKGLSGSGKSTLLNVLLGFVLPESGVIRITGHPLHQDHIHTIRSKVAWLPQELPLLVDRVRDLFLMPFTFARNKALLPTDREVAEVFEAFRLETGLLNKPLPEISGGQKQRVALASCVLLKRPLLLLDEPTSALDAVTKQGVMDFLFSLTDRTILALSHDPEWIARSEQLISLGAPSDV